MQVYGIDLSKDKFDVNFVTEDGVEKELKVSNTLSGISRFLCSLSSGAVLCAEHTGSYGDLLVFLCNQLGIKIALIPGYTLKHSMGNLRGKSDPLDARRIRDYATRYSDKLRFKQYPNEHLTELCELYKVRAQLVKSRKEILTGSQSRTKRPIQSRPAHASTQRIVLGLSKEIDLIEREMNEIILNSAELGENYRLLTSVTGIGPVIAIDLIIKTGNFKQIDSAKRAAAYAGVCPFPNSSGTMKKASRTSPYADKSLKTLMFMGALSAAKFNREYSLYYQRKKMEGKAHFLIMNNICNKLIRTLYAIIRERKPFDKLHVCIDPRKCKKLQ